MDDVLKIIGDILKIIILIAIILFLAKFLPIVLWILVPIYLFILAKDIWYRYIRNKHEQGKEWVLLEIVPPRDIVKTPQSMEQFFAGIHGIQGGTNWKDKHIDGKVQDYYSLEMISQGGNIHFLIRTLKKFRDLVEAHIYAQYPEAEIRQTLDYINSVPADLPDEDYNVWGTELIFMKDNCYPIRTHYIFEKDATIEEKRIDPIASLLEVMSKLKDGEQVWIQMLTRPLDDKWKQASEDERDKLHKRAKEKKQGEIAKEAVAWKDASKSVAHQLITGSPLEGGEGDSKDDPRWKGLLDPATKVERDIITAIEEKMSKIGYEVVIRYIYLARRDIYRESEVKKAIMGSFKQFNTQHMNGFKASPDVTPGALDYKYVQLAEPRNEYRRRKIFESYRRRFLIQHSKGIPYLHPLFFERIPIISWFFGKSKPLILNIEELASIFHFPAVVVKAPLTPKVESRRAEPPIGLPTQ